jgi:hypothetical protein
MRKEIDRHSCKDDQGNRYVVVVFQNFLPAGTLENPKQTVAGLKEARLLNGDPVNFVDEKTFMIVTGGTIIHKLG